MAKNTTKESVPTHTTTKDGKKVAEVVAAQHNEDGRIVRFLIRCSHPGCTATREIKRQDAHQVRFCREHADKATRREARTWTDASGAAFVPTTASA